MACSMPGGRRNSRFRETELGTECRCSRCHEWWPADAEFFFMCKGKPHTWCKACYIANDAAVGRRPGYGTGKTHNDHAET